MSCWQFIDQERASYPVELLCRTLAVSPARYYAWRKQQQPAPAQPVAANWEEALKETFGQHRRCYGTRRLRVELQAQGYRAGRQRLRAAMRRHGLRALQPRAYTPRTTDSTHGLRCAPNRLLDQHGCLRSQSRRDECLDNAQVESLWSRLKTEELGPREWPVFRNLADAQHSVATYFDYYNHKRRHSTLAYQTPQAFYLQQLKNTTLNSLA